MSDHLCLDVLRRQLAICCAAHKLWLRRSAHRGGRPYREILCHQRGHQNGRNWAAKVTVCYSDTEEVELITSMCHFEELMPPLETVPWRTEGTDTPNNPKVCIWCCSNEEGRPLSWYNLLPPWILWQSILFYYSLVMTCDLLPPAAPDRIRGSWNAIYLWPCPKLVSSDFHGVESGILQSFPCRLADCRLQK